MRLYKNNLFFALLLGLMAVISGCNETVPAVRPIIANAGQTEPEPEPEPVEPKRPDGAIFFKNDFCACNNGKSVIISSTTCINFCSTKQTQGVDLLYFNFTIGDELLAMGLNSVSDWCTTPIGTSTNPQCYLTVKSEAGDEPVITFDVPAGKNSFTANLSALSPDKTYILTLTEDNTKAKSNSIQLRKPSAGPGTIPLGPLIVQPVSRYTCINRKILQDDNNGDVFYEYAVRLHFNFIEKFRPEPVPNGVSDVFCHDVATHGQRDSSAFPRLEETPGAYALWSWDDIRFFDIDVSGKRDVNEIIAKKAADYGAPFAAVPNLFFELKMSSGPTINQVGNTASTVQALGFYMSYLNDVAAGNVAYCPKQAHYNSGDKALKAIGDVIQADTEGVYLGKRQTETYLNENDEVECLPQDIIVVREADVLRAWFYLHPTSKIPTQPTTPSSLRNNTIKFYYPFDFTSPYVKKSYQKEYTVITPDQVGQGTCSDDTGGTPTPDNASIPTTYTPHDRRFGCVPVSTTP